MSNLTINTIPIKNMMIFIDAEYVVKSLKNFENQKSIDRKNIHWLNLVNWINLGFNMIRCYYYTGKLDDTQYKQNSDDQKEYFNELKKNIQNLEIKLGKIIKARGRKKQKGVDVMLAVDLVVHASLNHYDIAVVIAGDYDFKYAIEQTKNLGKQVILYTFDLANFNPCADFIHSADVHNLIDSEVINSNKLVKD